MCEVGGTRVGEYFESREGVEAGVCNVPMAL